MRNTVAAAILIEHGFHTNTAECKLLKSNIYRDKLAEVDARGICDALGVKWIPADEPVDPDEPSSEDDIMPVHREGVAWCKQNGITDGSRPHDAATREEVCTMIYRASNLEK